MARKGPTFLSDSVGDTWAVAEWALHGDTPRALRIFEDPFNAARHRDVPLETTGFRWEGLRPQTVMNLRVDCLYENPQEEMSSFRQVQTKAAPPPSLKPVEGLRARGVWEPALGQVVVMLGWDRIDPRASHIEVHRDGPDGHQLLSDIVNADPGPGGMQDARVQPLQRYYYTLRSKSASGETADAGASTDVPAPPPAPAPATWREPEFLASGPAAHPGATCWQYTLPIRVHAFWLMPTGGEILHKWQESGGGWNSEHLPLAPFNQPVAFVSAATIGPHHLDLMYGLDGDVHHAWWDGTSWYQEGFDFPTVPASVGTPPGPGGGSRLDYFFRTEHGSLGHRSWRQGGGWSETGDLGGALQGHPAAAAVSPYRVDVFARTTTSTILHRSYNAVTDQWTPEEDLGGSASSDPGATTSGGALHLLYRNAQGRLVHRIRHSDAGWTAEADVGAEVQGAPAVTSSGTGVDVFYVSGATVAERFVWHRRWS